MATSKIGGKFDEMSHQLVIVMRGDPEKRSEIASKLAQFLKCPLIDADDIIDNEKYSSSRRNIEEEYDFSTTQFTTRRFELLNAGREIEERRREIEERD